MIDANAAAQEKGLAAVLVFVDYSPNAGKYVESILPGIITKCLTSSKAKTKELAFDIIFKCVEIDKQDITLEELIKGLDQKVPKNVAAVIRSIRECLSQFGAKVIAIKPLIPVSLLLFLSFLFLYEGKTIILSFYDSTYQDYSKIAMLVCVMKQKS